jgi:hypothetical protein
MKAVFTAIVTVAVLASIATAADARPRHRVCTTHHHHRVCRYVK